MQVTPLSTPLLQGGISGTGASALTVSAALEAFRANPTGVRGMSIEDSGSIIASNFDALMQMGTKVSGITFTDQTAPQLTLTAAQYSAGAATLGKVRHPYTVKVTQVAMDQLGSVLSNRRVTNVEVTDTSANSGTRFAALLNQPNRIDKVTQTGTPSALNLTGAQFTTGTSLGMLGKIWGNAANGNLAQGEYSLALRDVSMAGVITATGNAKVASVSVRDSSANLSANLAASRTARSPASCRQTRRASSASQTRSTRTRPHQRRWASSRAPAAWPSPG